LGVSISGLRIAYFKLGIREMKLKQGMERSRGKIESTFRKTER